MENIDNKVIDIMSKELREIKKKGVLITPETKLIDDLDMDSLDAMEVLIGLEEELGIDFIDKKVAEKIVTVQDLIDEVKRLIDIQVKK